MTFWQDPYAAAVEWLRNLLIGWGLTVEAAQLILYLAGGIVLAGGSLALVIFLIWAERKIIGRVQDRLGPNRVGPWGIFQTFADILKIFTKEYITPNGVDRVPYNLAPVLAVAAVIMIWAVVPFTVTLYGADLSVGLIYVMAVGAIGEMGIVMAGWGSNNKFALLGAFRAVAQMVSYEIPMVIALLIPVMMAGSLSLGAITASQAVWNILIAPLAALIFFITSVAEVGRAPFDLVEAESELVAGFNIEYSGLKFGFFFVGDFLHAFTIAMLFTVFFLGGWRGPFVDQVPILGAVYFFIKTSLVYLVNILMRAALPRFRIDQMMDFNWKYLTPLSLSVLVVTALADKLTLGLSAWVRIPVFLGLNGLLFLAASVMVNRRAINRPRAEVVSRPRPLARPETAVQPETNGGVS